MAALALPDPNEEIKHQIKKNTEIAQVRGKKAISHLRTGKEVSRFHQEKLVLQRDKAKTLEKIRSQMVSSLSCAKTKRKEAHKSLDSGERLCSNNVTTELSEPGDNEVPGGGPNEEELDEMPTSTVVPRLCLEDTPTERMHKREPVLSSIKAMSGKKVPSPSVQVYDHHNPCTTTQRQPPNVRVERTSLNFQTNAREAAELEMKEEAERRVAGTGAEDDARIKRGKKALAKELVRRDFDRLMTRLNGLARVERVARVTELPKLPSEIYMNEERTALKILKQQQDLESAFEGVLHGNPGINLGKDPLKSRDDASQIPLVVEQATFPEGWKIKSKDQVIDTSHQKLNVGICDHVSSTSGYEAENSFSSIHSTVNTVDLESDEIDHPNKSIDSVPPKKHIEGNKQKPISEEGASKDLSMDQQELQRRIKTARLLLEEKEDDDISVGPTQKLVDECNLNAGNQNSKGRSAWWCSLTSGRKETQSPPPALVVEEKDDVKEKNETERKIAVFKHSFELRGKTLEEVNLHMQKRKKPGLHVDTNESSSSTTSTSWRLEEVQVVVKVDDQSSERESSDRGDANILKPNITSRSTSGQTKSHRERKKKKAEEKQVIKLKELEDKMVPKQDKPSLKFPDVRELRRRKEKSEVASQETQVGKDLALKAPKKKRERKEAKEQRLGLQPPLSDSSYLSPPSHQELSDADRAKVLLDDIRSQRKRLEEWVGLKEHGNGKVNKPIGDYIQRLLSMTRESVADLSVSDVSSPVLCLSTPVVSDASSVVEVAEVPLPQKKYEDKAVGTSFDDSVEGQETVPTYVPVLVQKKKGEAPKDKELPADVPNLGFKGVGMYTPVLDQKELDEAPKDEKFLADVPNLGFSESLAEVKLRTKSPQFGPCILPKESPSPVLVIPEHHSRPPSPPPPSPEYDELSVLHSQRISQLGAKLSEIREIKKRLLTPLHSSDSESNTSPSSSTTSSNGELSSSIGVIDSSKKSDESLSSETSGRRKSWELLLQDRNGSETPEPEHVAALDDQDSEDSLLEKLLLESLHLSEPKKSFRPSEEVKASHKFGPAKVGPPPTAMKGGVWIGSDFQIPHELSTITEVDSKILSTTSLALQKKEKDLTTQHQPEPLEDPLKAPEVIQLKRVRPPPKTDEGEDTSSSWLKKIENLFLEVESILPGSTGTRTSAETTTPQEQKEDEESSDESLPASCDSSTGFPENLDEALRILGISPTILKGRKSQASREVSPVSSHHSQESPGITHSALGSTPKDRGVVLLTIDGENKTNVLYPEVEEPGADSEKPKSLLQFTPLGSFKELSLSTSSSKSPSLGKFASKGMMEEVVPEKLNFQSTPIGSVRDFTFGSGSSSISEGRAKVKNKIVQGTSRSMGESLMELELSSLREKSSSEQGKSDQGSPIIPKETPQSILKHSTPLHSFSGEGSSSSNSEERKRSRTCFPFVGDSAPSSISGGNASEGTDWKHISDENDVTNRMDEDLK
ncbi:uncharacterized protein [Hetaerina americana]|uniref:uncharacterized protein n=1 Tax=Hetaerina americana TaxID=62018 RepID=UPI003A7F2A97